MRYTYLQAITEEGRMPWMHSEMGETIFYASVYHGQADAENRTGQANIYTAAENVWITHNTSDRPRGQEIRSMVVGDAVVLDDGTTKHAMIAASIGFVRLDDDSEEAKDLIRAADRNAHTVLDGDALVRALLEEERSIAAQAS